MSEFKPLSSTEGPTTHPGDVSFFIGRDGLIVPNVEFYLAGEATSPAANVFSFMQDLYQRNNQVVGKIPRDEILTLSATDERPAIQLRSFYSGLTDAEAEARLPHLGEYRRMVDKLATLPRDVANYQYDDRGRIAFHTTQHPLTAKHRMAMRDYLQAHIPDVLGIQGVETFLVNIDETGEGFPEKFMQMNRSYLMSHTYFLGDESMFGLPIKNPSTGWRTYIYQGDSSQEPTYLFADRKRQTDEADLTALYGSLEVLLR
ncbi:MAG TPA: hypothetical protein VHD60_03520 [Candidatus Saccharimonadales bacterium]|nr:hypothetical protein [Candidatus Saccharimonadales bacterium]